MTASRWHVAFLLAGALIVGCDDKKGDQPKPNPTPAAGPTTAPSTPKTDSTKVGDAAGSTIDAAKIDLGKAADPSKLTLDPAKIVAPAIPGATPKTSDGSTAAATTDAAKAAAAKTDAATTAQASEWIAKLGDAIKANKLDEAKTYLDKLDAIKGSLSPEWKAKLDSLKTAYEAARLKNGVPNLTK